MDGFEICIMLILLVAVINRTRPLFKKPRDKSDIITYNKKWSDEEVADFIIRLKQVIGRTEKLSEDFDHSNSLYDKVFRQINPVIDGAELYRFGGHCVKWNLDDYSYSLYERLLAAAINTRGDIYEENFTNLDERGRIICFQTCNTTHDGGPCAASKSFADASDAPPIDTWFFLKKNYGDIEHYSEQTLFCWIPKDFLEVMQDAIDIEILDSYRWLDEYDIKMYHVIKGSV